MHSLAQRVLSHIRRQELLKAGDRVGVAVSGGIDSVALLRLLLELRGELGIVLSVVHFNHKLRGAESDADQEFVAQLAREHNLEFYFDSDDVSQHAADEHISVEAAARELRYGFFRCLLGGDTSGAEARPSEKDADRSVESAAPPKSDPQGLKPHPKEGSQRGPEGPLFHGGSDGAAGSRAPSNQISNPIVFRLPTLDKIVTGHTLDDQAETVLMRMIRGAGTRGLGGIHPRMAVEDADGENCGEIVRPLLGIRRRELKAYLFDIRQEWREDSSNADDSFTRNRVRRLLVPLLEKEFNPAIAENLAELAKIARDEEDFWENEVAGWMGTAVHWSEPEWTNQTSNPVLVQIASIHDAFSESPTSAARGAAEMGHPKPSVNELQTKIDAAPWLVANASVDRRWFLGEPAAAQRRLIKAIGERVGIPLEFKHVEEIRRCAENDESGKELSLPLGWKMVREPDELIFVTPDLREGPLQIEEYEYDIPVPGRIFLPETNSFFEALSVPASEASGYNPDQLLDAQSLLRPLRVRNWRPGDRFWPAHTKSPKKVKELLQEQHAAHEQRKLWPLVASGSNNEVVWMRGFPTPSKFQPQAGHDAILIQEKPLSAKAEK